MGILFQSIKTPLINLLGKKQSLFVNEDGTIVLTKERKIFKKITEEVMRYVL